MASNESLDSERFTRLKLELELFHDQDPGSRASSLNNIDMITVDSDDKAGTSFEQPEIGTRDRRGTHQPLHQKDSAYGFRTTLN